MERYKKIIGWVGVSFIITAYALLIFDLVKSQSVSYNLINLIGAILLAYRVYLDRNYSNFFLEIVFIIIALIGIFKNL